RGLGVGCRTSTNAPRHPWRLAPASVASFNLGPLLTYHSNPFYLETDSGKRLVLRSQQQTVGKEAGPAQQGTLGGDPCQLRKIIVLRKMPKNDVGGLAVVIRGKKLGGSVV